MKIYFIYLFCIFTFFCSSLFGQFNYTLTTSTTAWSANSSPTTIHAATIDDALSSAINIGFTFNYACTDYTQVKVSSNGWLTFNTAITSSITSNNLNTSSDRPIIAPLWDDLQVYTGGTVNYKLTGSSPNRIFTVEWSKMEWNFSASGDVISFQCKLYETTNVVEFVYLRGATAVNSGSASIGIGGLTSGQFYSLDGIGASPTASTVTETNTLSAKPATNQHYIFTPNSCSGTPTAGTSAASPASICSGSTSIISLSGNTSSCGITYQWEQSADGSSGWANVTGGSGATTTSYTTPALTSSTYYRCKVTCSNSSLYAYSTSVQVVIVLSASCYCTSTATSTSDMDITNVTFSTINNTSATVNLTGTQGTATGTAGKYSNWWSSTVPTPSVQQGSTTSFSVTVGGTAWSHRVDIYIDFNQDGDLVDAGESFAIFAYANPTLPNTTTVNILIPITATIGNTLMRVVCIESSSTSNCSSYTYGETEDYKINITTAPPCAGTPTAGTATASPTSVCSPTTSTISVTGYTAATGITFQWEQSADGSSGWANVTGGSGATSVSYTTPALASSTYYRCKVTCTNSALNASTAAVLVTVLNAVPTCATSLVPSNSATSVCNPVSLSWTAPVNAGCNAATGYDVYFESGTTPPTTLVSSNQAGTSYSVGNLTGGTTYYWKIVPRNSIGTATGCTTQSFTTMTQNYTSLPYSQDFEGSWIDRCDTREAPDQYWQGNPITGNNSWRRVGDGTSSGSWSTGTGSYWPESSVGTYSAEFNGKDASSGTTGSLDLYLDLSPAGTKLLCFDYINPGTINANDKMVVLLSTDGGSTFPTTLLTLPAPYDSWSTQSVDITSTSSTGVIRFLATADWGSSGENTGIDNVSIILPCAGTPTAGNTVASPASICSGNTSVLSLSGNVLAGGLTYQWQSSADGSTWSDIVGATSLSYSATPGSDTYYKCNITCTSSGLTSSSVALILDIVNCYNMDDTPVTTCSGYFYDSGGPTGDYGYGDYYIKTFTSDNPSSALVFTFNSFETDDSWDWDEMYIYDGPNDTYPQVTSSPFSGTTIPGTITSSGNSLTVEFYDDTWYGYEYAGWEISISCTPITVPDCESLSSPSNGYASVCPGLGATLTWTPVGTGFTATSYQLYFGTDNPPTNIINGTNIGSSTSYTTDPLDANTTYYWRVFPVNAAGTNSTCTTTYSFTTQNISITSTNSPVTTCENTANLTATGSGTINWYTSPTGGSAIATGSPYYATFSGNTTYYVGASNGSLSNYSVGKAGPATSSFASSSMGIWFDVLTPLTINTVDVYVTTLGTNLTVRLQDDTYTDIQTKTFTNMPAGLNTLTLNFSISTTGTYVLISEDGVSLGMDNSETFPYTVPGVISLTSSEWWGVQTGEYDYFYNWQISAGTSCESARVPVNVIHTAPDITITPSGATTFLLGGSVDLIASSTASPVYSYTWSPASGLNTTSGATVTASPTTTTTYTATGTNGTPCTQTAQVIITVIQPCTGLGTGVTNVSSLPYTTTGQTTSGKVNDISNSNAVICGSSSYYTGNDVVYTFTPTATGSITITLTSAGSYTGVMLYEGCPMNGQGGSCVSYSQSSTGNKSMCVTVSANVEYYLIIDSYSTYTSSNSYDLTITAPDPSANLNDLPCSAVNINSGDLTPGDNSCATATGEPTAPSCWTNGTINSVWYLLTTGAAQTSIKIRTIVGTLLNTQIAVYSGACGSGMSLIACNDDAAACGSSQYDNSELTVTVSPSTTYYIVVDGYSDLLGTFSIVWIDGATSWPAVPGQDCSSGVPMCASTFTVGNPGYQAVGNTCDFGTSYCLASGERGSAWYEITINADGDLKFSLEPNDVTGATPLTNDGTDYDFAIWKKTGTGAVTCSDISANTATPLRCNYSYIGVTGLYDGGNNPTTNSYTGHTYTSGAYNAAFETPLPVLNGEVYWLVISNFSNSQSGFTINFTSSSNGFNFSVPNPLIWTGGASSTDWFDARNWGNCSTIPTSTIDCIIAASSIYQPVIAANSAICKSITINSGATLTINSTRNLEITGNFNNQGTLNAVSGSSVTMTGTAAQTMDGIMVSPSEFSSLTINKTAGSVQLNQNIETSSTLTTSSSTSILNTNGNYVTVGGNLTLNAPSTYTNFGTTGTLEMNGSSLQTINAGGTLDLCNFTMNNTNGGVNLSNDIQLNTLGVLTLSNGILNTSTNKITVQNSLPTSITGHSIGSYLNGNLRRYISTGDGFDFPVGTSSQYEYSSLDVNSISGTNPYLDVKFTNPNSGTTPSGISVNGTSVTTLLDYGFWTFVPTNVTTINYDISLTSRGHSNGASDPAMHTIIKRTSSGTVWVTYQGNHNNNTQSGTGTNPVTAVLTNMTSFSDAAIAKGAIILPIDLLSFEFLCLNSKVLLKWVTANETNNQMFILQRSKDGSNFEPITNIDGNGNSNIPIEYSYSDNINSDGTVYYKLLQVDFDGTTSVSGIISTNCVKINNNISIFNPINDNNLTINFAYPDKYNIQIYDQLGRKLSEKSIVVNDSDTNFIINKNDFAIGIYNMVISSSIDVVAKQIVITQN